MLQRHAADRQRSQQDAQAYFDRLLLKEVNLDRKGSGDASEEKRLVNFLAGVFDHTVTS